MRKKDKSAWNYFTDCLFTKKFFDFSGRARRKEFWSYILFKWLLIFLIAAVTGIIDIEYVKSHQKLIQNAAFLVFLVPDYAVLTRRLHDINFSGGWAFILFAIGFFYHFPNTFPLSVITEIPFLNLIYLAALAVCAAITLIRSNTYTNEYGPAPDGIKPKKGTVKSHYKSKL